MKPEYILSIIITIGMMFAFISHLMVTKSREYKLEERYKLSYKCYRFFWQFFVYLAISIFIGGLGYSLVMLIKEVKCG